MRRLLLALLLLVPLLACSSGDDADPLADDEGSGFLDDLADDLDTDDPEDEAPELTVLDAGAEPRQVLRLDPPEDCVQRVTLLQEMDQRVSSEGIDQETSQGTSYDVTYRCTEITDDHIDVATTFDSVRLLHSSVDTPGMDDLLEAMEGAESQTRYDHQGAILDAELPDLDLEGEVGDILGPMFDQLGEGLGGSAAALPSEPIGLGGRWRTSQVIDAAGIRMRQTSVYEVVELTADVVRTDVTTEMEVLDADFDFPGMPSDAEVDVVSGSFEGSGTSEWDLHAVVPLQTTVMDGSMRMRMSVDGDEFELEQSQHQELSTVAR